MSPGEEDARNRLGLLRPLWTWLRQRLWTWLRQRPWTWLRQRPLSRHLLPLLALTGLHIAVFERSLRGTDGMPMNVIPYDFLDSYFRFFVYISDTIHAGALPIWYPYGHAGSPFFMYPQSQLWSPVTWLVSLLFGYNLLIAQWQQWMTLLVGSFGAYGLAYNLWRRRSGALVAAIAFNFTSARLCNAEHMDIITAFSMFPWVFLGLRTVAQGWKPGRILTAVFLSLLVVSGYPGVVLLSPLWFGGWTVWLCFGECGDRARRQRFLADVGLSTGLGALMSAGFWLPILIHGSAFTRGEPMPTDAALAQSLAPVDLWHLVYAPSTHVPPTGAAADVSMRGLYFGILALALGLWAVLYRRDRATTVLGIGFVAALLMSMGNVFFARIALHDYVSSLNLSRFPSADSRAVAALAGSLLAGAGLSRLVEATEARRSLLAVLGGFVLLLLCGLVWLKSVIYPQVALENLALSFSSVVTIELFVLVVALICVARFDRPRTLAIAVVLLVGVDSGMHARVDAPLSAVSKDEPLGGRAIQARDAYLKAFDPAQALVPRINGRSLVDTVANDGYLNKKFYLPWYSSFRLRRFDHLLAAEFQPFLLNGKRVVGFAKGEPPDKGPAFEAGALPVDFEIPSYLPDRVVYNVNLPARTTLVFNEVYFPGWRARIDFGKSVPMQEVAGGLRALTVDAGKHIIATRFSPALFWVGLTLTLLGWLLAFVWLGVGLYRSRSSGGATV